jgi:nucleotide-binding universal stress UspA family protein
MADIVVGYDGSDCAKAGLSLATEAAKALGDRVLVVWTIEAHHIGGEVKDYEDALKELGERVTAEGAEAAKAAGVEVERLLLHGDSPASALSELAAERDARMIVVGTHGESPLKGALIGSTPHKLIQLAQTPVVVVPART